MIRPGDRVRVKGGRVAHRLDVVLPTREGSPAFGHCGPDVPLHPRCMAFRRIEPAPDDAPDCRRCWPERSDR